MQMWKYSLTVHQPILCRLYWNQSFCWNWDNRTSFNPRFVFLLTCSAASGSRWVSSRGTVNWIFLGLPVSMVALSVKKGDGMKRRMEWSKQRQSKRRVRSSGSETEKKNKWVPVSKWDYFLLFLSYLCFNTFSGLRSSSIDSTPFFLSPWHLLVSLSPLSFLFLTPSLHRGKGIVGEEHLSFALIRCTSRQVPPSCYISFSVLDDEDCSAAALHKWEDF